MKQARYHWCGHKRPLCRHAAEKAGVDYVILEARDRTGGRVLSLAGGLAFM
jgi:hypothetical protein